MASKFSVDKPTPSEFKSPQVRFSQAEPCKSAYSGHQAPSELAVTEGSRNCSTTYKRNHVSLLYAPPINRDTIAT